MLLQAIAKIGSSYSSWIFVEKHLDEVEILCSQSKDASGSFGRSLGCEVRLVPRLNVDVLAVAGDNHVAEEHVISLTPRFTLQAPPQTTCPVHVRCGRQQSQ